MINLEKIEKHKSSNLKTFCLNIFTISPLNSFNWGNLSRISAAATLASRILSRIFIVFTSWLIFSSFVLTALKFGICDNCKIDQVILESLI